MGIGAGQFSVYIERDLAPYDSGKLSDPHNGLLEIASQYGIIIIILLCWFYFELLRNYFQSSQFKERIFILCHYIFIFISLNMNSSFISSPVNWFLILLPVMWFIPSIELKKN
jgi:O-antigen ligase